MGNSVLVDDISLLVNCILTYYVQRSKEDAWDLSDFGQWKRKDETLGNVVVDEFSEEFSVQRCSLMVGKYQSFIDVLFLVVFVNFSQWPVGSSFEKVLE